MRINLGKNTHLIAYLDDAILHCDVFGEKNIPQVHNNPKAKEHIVHQDPRNGN